MNTSLSSVNHSYFHRLMHDVRLRWCVISLPEQQNNTGGFIVLCVSFVRGACCVRASDWSAPQRRAAPGSSGAERTRSFGRQQRAPSRAGRADDVMWSLYGRPAAATGGLALKSGCRPRPLLTTTVRVVAGAEAQKLGGWPRSGEWM